MRIRTGEAIVLGAGALALVAAVVLAAGSSRWGLALLAVAVSAGLAGLARVAQIVIRRLGAIEQSVTQHRREGRRAAERSLRVTRKIARTSGKSVRMAVRDREHARSVEQRQDQRHTTVSGHLERTNARLEQAGARLDELRHLAVVDGHRFRTSLDTLPSDVVRLHRMSERLLPGTDDFPGMGDWAVTPATLVAMVNDVSARSGPITVVECGSGTSTLFLALALAQRPEGGRVVALESDADFAEETRGHLRRLGVDHLAEVVDAPLVEQEIAPGDRRLWFDTSRLPDVGEIDLLFVDGPVGGTSHEARYPAYPVLGARLRDGATVVLDDSDRPDERSILAQWIELRPDGRRLEVTRRNVRSTLLRVVREA